MQQHPVRFPDATFRRIRDAAMRKGFAFTSASEFIRHAVNQGLTGGDGDEQRIAATLGQISGPNWRASKPFSRPCSRSLTRWRRLC